MSILKAAGLIAIISLISKFIGLFREQVIGGHYGEQIDILSKEYKEEKELKKKFIKFREEELEHKNTAESLGANNDGLYSILDTVIKNSSKLAIAISKKY